MLNNHSFKNTCAVRDAAPSSRQGGFVLMVALIILVALTIAGIALIRSVDTTNIIAGNMAFQQAAIHSAQAGVEDAIHFLEASTSDSLQNNNYARGYAASVFNPSDWDNYWSTVINPNPVATPAAPRSCADRACSLPIDAAGNTVSYTIQRLCQTTGDPILMPTGCSSIKDQDKGTGSSQGAGYIPPELPAKYYYRITTRIAGPRNTLSYVQTIVAAK